MNQSPFATSLVREAAQGTVGGFLTWLCTCAVAGIIPTAAAAEGFDNASWAWAFAWLGHLAIAGIAVWGVVVICIHVACLSALIHGTGRVLRVVAAAFGAQLTTSAIAVVSFDHDTFRRVAIAWLVCTIPLISFVIGSFVVGRQEVAAKRFGWRAKSPGI
jgi:hypothetical protein